MYMPGGMQQVNVTLNQKKPVAVKVLVNASSATALNQQLTELNAKSAHRAYFDFNHEDGAASFWPESFSWKETPSPGIYAKGEWSDAGKAAIVGKTFRAFSGVFHVDGVKNNPAKIVAQPAARLNMGGLVNTPAFKEISALWAKEAVRPAATRNQPKTQHTIMKLTLVELKAKLPILTAALAGLRAKTGDEAATPAELSAAETEIDLVNERISNAELRASGAKTIVLAHVKRGAIPAQNMELQAKYQGLIEQDPTNASILDSLPGTSGELGRQITNGEAPNRLEAKEGVARCMKAFGELTAKNADIGYTGTMLPAKMDLARKATAIFRKELAACDMAGVLMELQAADSTDANLGVLTGTLVAQRTLELFRLEFDLLKYIWTDFSEVPAAYKQDVETRIMVVPGVQAFDNTVNAQTGEPNGWSYVTLPQTTDVKITLDELVGCPIRFGLDILSSTSRRLFDEQAPGAAYALAKHFVEKLYALLTPANFNGYAAVVANKVPVAYPSYTVGLGDFARSSLIKLKTILDPNEVPKQNRYCLLNAAYHGQLGNDPSITQFYAAVRQPGIIEEGDLPTMAKFKPIEAENLTANNATANLVGFAGQRSALAIAARLPVDLNQVLPGAQQGSVVTMLDSELGIPWQLVQIVNQTKGYAQWQLQSLMGVAKGDKRGGICILSQ